MEDAIKGLIDTVQFYFPQSKNADALKPADSFCGLYGRLSLSAGLLKIYNPAYNIHVHRDYGLPTLPKTIREQYVFASSYQEIPEGD